MPALKVLTETQRQQYETDGYLVLESFVSADWPAKWARHDPRPCLLLPSVIGTIFQAQQNEM